MKSIVISQPMYFPWVGMFEQIRLADVFVHYDDVQFSKGSFFNRVQIKIPTGFKWMTVPLKNHKLGQNINQIELSDESGWQQNHLELLKQNYAGASFVNEMLSLVDSVVSASHSNLAELSQASIEAVCDYYGLKIDREWAKSSELNIPGQSTQRVLDIAQHFGSRTYITGHGARQYFDHELLERNGIRTEYIDYRKRPYPQLHGEFNPFVSILDLIANVGKDGIEYLCSTTCYWKLFVERHNNAA